MSKIKLLLFDAANTLVHKPVLWSKMIAVLEKNDHKVDLITLQKNHKLISELISFPDRTSATFYKNFNGELLYSLGIIPNDQLLDDLFKACTYLEWEPFEDALSLSDIPLPKAIISNFNNTLSAKIGNIFAEAFYPIITSEEIGHAKPSEFFYEEAIKIVNEKPENILYIGDSIKLDMEPATKIGMNAYLIDRLGCFPNYPNRINSFHELKMITNNIR